MNTNTWYFWKWSTNRLDGQPSEVCQALARFGYHPATKPFDPAPLIGKLEQARMTLGNNRSRWRWSIVKDPATRLARHVKLILPHQAWDYPVYQEWINLFLPLNLFGWTLEWDESFPGTLPKKNVWKGESTHDTVSAYDVKPGDVSRLMKHIRYAGVILLMNHRNDYVNVGRAYGRYTVEWRSYAHVRKNSHHFSHWRCGYAGDPAFTAAGQPIARKFMPAGINDERRGSDGNWHHRLTVDGEYELLTPGDAAFIMRAFLRGEGRPPHFRWISLTSRFKRIAISPYP
jgi:hypothetical protein